MNNFSSLLKIEWLKIKSYKTFWILMGFYTVFLTLLYWNISNGSLKLGTNGVNLLNTASGFTQVWKDVAFYSSYVVILLSILMAILVCNEYQFRTNRQNIIDGWDKLSFWNAKWYLAIVISAYVTLFAFVLGIVSAVFLGLSFEDFAYGLPNLLWLFLCSVNYMGLAILLSVLLRRTGIVIAIYMGYSMLLEPILHWIFLLKYQMPSGNFFLPLQASDEMFSNSISKLIKQGINPSFAPGEWHFALATCIWIALYYFVGRSRLLKSDW